MVHAHRQLSGLGGPRIGAHVGDGRVRLDRRRVQEHVLAIAAPCATRHDIDRAVAQQVIKAAVRRQQEFPADFAQAAQVVLARQS
ncbi:hypothetical protein G6F40_016972 [Rhizopus arrhizus]|nr:hypothetical protein G6F40_016972 [Rhizopus arrhizus]